MGNMINKKLQKISDEVTELEKKRYKETVS